MTPADQITEALCPNPHCGLGCEYCAAKKAAAKVMRKVRRILLGKPSANRRCAGENLSQQQHENDNYTSR